MFRRCGWCGFIALFCTSILLARQGTLETWDGKRISGDIQDDPGSNSVIINNRGVSIGIPRKEITSIEYADDLQADFARDLAALDPTDVQGRLDLSRRALDQKMFVQARQAALEAQKIDPTNADAQLMLQTIQSEQVLESRPAPAPATEPSEPIAAAPQTPSVSPAELLSDADINVIRQWELRPGEKVRVEFTPNVRADYLHESGDDASTFSMTDPIGQANKIIHSGDPKLSAQVPILDDPSSMREFHQSVLPKILVGCTASGCHGGDNGQQLLLYPYSSSQPQYWYSDFYILRMFKQQFPVPPNAFGQGPMLLPMIDSAHPDRSLLIQYGLPRDQAAMPHPDVPNFRPLFADERDPTYILISRWIGQGLKPFAPEYGINRALPTGTAPATQP